VLQKNDSNNWMSANGVDNKIDQNHARLEGTRQAVNLLALAICLRSSSSWVDVGGFACKAIDVVRPDVTQVTVCCRSFCGAVQQDAVTRR